MMADDNAWRMLRFMNLMGLFFFCLICEHTQLYSIYEWDCSYGEKTIFALSNCFWGIRRILKITQILDELLIFQTKS